MASLYTTRETCRICTGNLKEIIDLGELCLSTFVENASQEVPKVPMTLCVCEKCNLVQLKHTVNGDVMYKNEYWYKSGLNASMVKALEDVANQSYARVDEEEDNDVWLDIGSNDNTMLKYIKERWPHLLTVGFDPTPMDRYPVDIFVNDYFSSVAYANTVDKKAKIVTMIACFYDLEDPRSFINQVRAVLADDGIWVIQMMDLLSMWRTHDFPNICHEHLEYYSLNVLNELLNQHDLEIFDLEYNDVNGGSLRVYVRHDQRIDTRNTGVVEAALYAEKQYFAGLGDPYQYFRDKVNEIEYKITEFIGEQVANHKKVAAFGASTKGNTLLQFFGLDYGYITHAAEVNPDKYGLRTVGTNIPIIPQTESLELHPDYYFVLPHGFINFFIKKHRDYLRKGGKFIVALPEPSIISWQAAGPGVNEHGTPGIDVNGEGIIVWTRL